jgi:putative chitinase
MLTDIGLHNPEKERHMSTILKLGSSGPDVAALQKALLAAGFNPGSSDGSFGPATEAAVLGLQRSKGLSADGIVGPTTASALGLSSIPVIPSVIPGVTVQVVSMMFPVTPRANIAANLPSVLDAMGAANLPDKVMVLMALGTIRAETESFEPISEGQSRFNTSPSGHPFDLYDHRQDLGNMGAPDGANVRGRGFVQLTGRANYQRLSQELNVNLVDQPELANQPTLAAKILTQFLADREDRIREALAEHNLAAARKLVNGGSNGLDRFVDAFNRGMQLIPEAAQAADAGGNA